MSQACSLVETFHSLVGQGLGAKLDSEQRRVLLNASNLAGYRKNRGRLLTGLCPFCGELDPSVNRVDTMLDSWRGWSVDQSLQKAGSRQVEIHDVIAPFNHKRHISQLNRADWRALWALVDYKVRTNFADNYPVLAPHFEGDNVDDAGIFATVVIPSGRCRVEATFNTRTDGQLFGQLQEYHVSSSDTWTCWKAEPTEALTRYIILPNEPINKFSMMEQEDYEALSELISFLTLKPGLPGGALLMGLPGGALTMRFGEIMRSAASILHLHCNLKKWLTTIGNIKETLAKNPNDVEVKAEIAAIWEKMCVYFDQHPNASEEEAMGVLTQDEVIAIKTFRK